WCYGVEVGWCGAVVGGCRRGVGGACPRVSTQSKNLSYGNEIEQYFPNDNITLEVIVKENSPQSKRTIEVLSKHILQQLQMKTLMDAIEKRFGGNKESKKTQKTLLKQQYGNFNGSSSEGLDQTFDKLQNLISQLEI
ncbi:hypothetical protein Tco_1091812, partial [Tanacetum coccineum]